MPFVPTPNVAQVQMRYTYQGQQVMNTLYFDFGAGFDTTQMQALASFLVGSYASETAPESPASLILREVQVTDWTTETSPSITYNTGLPLIGGTGQPAAPSNVSLTVSFRTEGRGRSSRGRNYLLGIQEAEVDNNVVGSAFSNRWTSFLNTLIDPGPPECIWVVVSTIEDGLPRAAGLVQPVSTFVFVDMTVDSQRRRLPGRGS